MKKLLYILLPITLLVIYICSYQIGKQYMWSDEIFSFHAAKRILETGSPIYESGLEYSRSGIYHYLLAFSMKLFGIDEFGSRVINIPFLIGTWAVISVFIYSLLDKLKDIKRRVLISYIGGLLYFISNFSIAMLRETRMYSMSTFFLITTVFLIYKAIISPSKGIHIKWFNMKIDLRYAIPSIFTLLIALDTQPINIILGLGLILFFTLYSLFYKNIKYIIISLALVLLASVLAYLRYDTLNLLTVFESLSPQWAQDSSLLYYSILTVRNLPFVLFTSLISIYYLFKKKNLNILYLGSLVLGFLSFLSFQNAQHERYWQVVIPLLFIVSIYVIYLSLKDIQKKNIKYFFITLLAISLIFHLYLSVKEITEIDTYTPHSLSLHKKLQFREVFEYLEENDTQDTFVVGDFHTVYTLIEKDIEVDYLLLTDTDVNWKWGKNDLYFNIPLINESELEELSKKEDGYLIIRDTQKFEDILFEKESEYIRPVIYEF